MGERHFSPCLAFFFVVVTEPVVVRSDSGKNSLSLAFPFWLFVGGIQHYSVVVIRGHSPRNI